MKALTPTVLLLSVKLLPTGTVIETPGDNKQNLTRDCLISAEGKCISNKLLGIPAFPVNIDTRIHILKILDVDDDLGTVEMIADLSFEWKVSFFTNHDRNQETWQNLNEGWENTTWYPTIFVKNLKNIQIYFSGKASKSGKSLWTCVANLRFLLKKIILPVTLFLQN